MGGWCDRSLRSTVRLIAVMFMICVTFSWGFYLYEQIPKMLDKSDNDELEIQAALISIGCASIVGLNYLLYDGATQLKAGRCKVWLFFHTLLLVVMIVASPTKLVEGPLEVQLKTLGVLGAHAYLWIVVFMFIREIERGVNLPK